MTTHSATPPPRRGTRDWGEATTKARRHPGEWVLIFERVPRSYPNAHTRGRLNALKDNTWSYELITRNTVGNIADLWMRARRWSDIEKEQQEEEEE